MPLVTHVGAATNAKYSGLESVALLQVESGNFVSKRAIWWMIFAGVFERHPGLKLVITETLATGSSRPRRSSTVCTRGTRRSATSR